MKTYSTFLPIFTGFYNNSNFEINLYSEITHIHDVRKEYGLNIITDIDLDVDNNLYEHDIANALCEYIESEFNSNDVTKISIKFDKVVSPREYNFINDSIDCEIECDVEKLLQICSENLTKFTRHVSENYTSCSGFWSRYSNDVSEWLDIEYIEQNSKHTIGALLNFICTEIYEIDEPSSYDLNIHESNYITNIDYYLELQIWNNEAICFNDVANFNKGCFWFRQWSGLCETNFETNFDSLTIRFCQNMDKFFNEHILKNLEYSLLIDFDYKINYEYTNL